jgi:hypothetical protein
MVVVVDRFHDALAVCVCGGEHRIAVPVREPVEGENPPGDELLDEVVHRRFPRKKALELRFARDLVRRNGADADVGLRDDGIARLPHEPFSLLEGARDRPAGHCDSRVPENGFHPGFRLDGGDVLVLDPEHVEIRAEAGLGFQPVLVVRVDPVEFPVPLREIAARPKELVVVVQVVHPIIIAEGLFQLRAQRIVRRIREPQHVGPHATKVDAETIIVRGKMGG